MKKLSFILVLLINSFVTAQYYQDSPELKQAINYYYNDEAKLVPMVQNMIDNKLVKIAGIDLVNPDAYFTKKYLYHFRTTNEEYKMIMFHIIVHYIKATRNSTKPLKRVHFRMGVPIGKSVADYSSLSKRVYYTHDMDNQKTIKDPNLDWNISFSRGMIKRFEAENQIIIYRKGILIRSTLWNAWNETMKSDMTFLLAFTWGFRFKDYTYNIGIKVLPDVDKGIPPKSIDDLPITRIFKRPDSDEEFKKLSDDVFDRYHNFNVESYYLVQGEKDRVTLLIEQKKLVVNHEKRIAYIHPDEWNPLSKEEKNILMSIITFKCCNECRDSNYRLSLNDLHNRNKEFASANK